MQVGKNLQRARVSALMVGCGKRWVQVSKEAREENCPCASCGNNQDRLCVFQSYSSIISELDLLAVIEHNNLMVLVQFRSMA